MNQTAFSGSVVSFTCMTFYSGSFGSLKGFESADKVMSTWVSTDAGRCHSQRARTTGESGSAERGEREENKEAAEEEGETELLQDVKKRTKRKWERGKIQKLVPSTWVDKLVGRCCFVEWVRFQSCWCEGGCLWCLLLTRPHLDFGRKGTVLSAAAVCLNVLKIL